MSRRRNKHKYITVRKTGNITTSFIVDIHFWNGEKRMHYVKSFPVKDPRLEIAVLQAALDHRDEKIRFLSSIQFDIKNVPKDITVNELFKSIPDNFKRSLNTYEKYQMQYQKYIKPILGNRVIQSVTGEEIQKTLIHCSNICAQKSVNDLYALWKLIYRVANKKGIVFKDVLINVEIPESSISSSRQYFNLVERNISEEDFQSFLDFMSTYGGYQRCEYERIYFRQVVINILRMDRFTGLRLQEILPLETDDFAKGHFSFTDSATGERIYCDGYAIRINKSLGSTQKESLAIKEPKSKSSYRYIPVVNEENIKIVEQILANARHKYVFSDYHGNLIHSRRISDYINRVRHKYEKVTGRKLDFYIYLLRKSLLSDQSSEHVDPATIIKSAGHADFKTTSRYYLSSDDEKVIEAFYKRKFRRKKKNDNQLSRAFEITDEEEDEDEDKDESNDEPIESELPPDSDENERK